MIPWIIVVLNVIVTMLNSMFERRKEIGILSSIGLNPSHIGGIFLAEAAIIGVVGGGVGYFLGLAGYRGMLALSVAIEVRQKVSAFWSFASVGVAAAAVLVGTGIAIKSSVIITPSLLRKWSKEKWLEETGGQWEFQMPIRLHEDGVTALFRYLKERIPAYILSRYVGLDPNFVMKRMKDNETDTSVAHIRSLTFNYFFGQGDFLGSSPSTLIAEKKKGEETYSLKLLCPKIETTSVKKKVTFIRMMIVDWDAQRK
jgi:hypothetical protein